MSSMESIEREHAQARMYAKWWLWGICLVALGITLAIAVVMGSIAAANAVTSGPRDELSESFKNSCKQQFEAAQYPAVCLTFLKDDDP